MTQPRSLSRVLDRIDKGFMTLSIVLMFITVILMNAEIICRYLLGISLLISDEYSGYFFAASTMMCLLPALRSGRFIRIEGVLKMLPGRFQAVLELFAGLCGAVISGVLAWQTWLMTVLSYELGTVSIQISETPQYIPQAILPICLGLLCVAFLEYGLVCAGRCWRGEAPVAQDGDTYVVD